MATPTTVNATVFSLAGSQGAPVPPPVPPSTTFVDPVPLGVRIYSPINSLDVWVTRWVSDLTYRSVVPGGFASATFTLRTPQHVAGVSAAWSPRAERNLLVRLFNRVQIVDLRSGEIAWEGRIESAARGGDDGWAWDIGCTGAMVSATDITRPVFYVDSSLDYWLASEQKPSLLTLCSFSKSADTGALKVDFVAGGDILAGDAGRTTYHHFLCFTTNQYIGRFSITYSSNAPSVTNGTTVQTRANVYTPSTDTWQSGVDATNLGAADVRKTNAVGGSSSFTSTQAQVVNVDIWSSTNNVTIPTSLPGAVYWVNPTVIAMRMDRNGNNLTTAASYGTDYVTVSQVVEDVVGRYLNNGWGAQSGYLNNPAPGSVSATNCYIDTSDTTQITDLKWPDGVTAADILNTLMTVQTDGYWAIWESTYTATDDYTRAGYRFEWSTWPNGWGYLASSADGIDEQPDAGDIYNYVWYQSTYAWPSNIWMSPTFNQENWTNDGAPLLNGNLTRGATVKKDGIEDPSSSFNSSTTWLAANGTEKNAGTITIARPIQLYDKGTGTYSGASRMLDPHMLRPGKLIRVTDLPASADGANFAHGDTAPPATHAGVVFKVVATNYDANSNTCTMELDQPSTWSLPSQIVPGAKTNVQTIPG